MNKVSITLKTANNRPAGRGTMTIGDATIDGQDGTVIFWDPVQPTRLMPGTQLEVVFDGDNAKWDERNGKRSFQIRPAAQVTYLDGGAAPATQAAGRQMGSASPQTQSPQAKNKLTEAEVLTKAADAVRLMTDLLVERGLPEEVVVAAAANAPQIYPLNWFGEKE